MLCMAKFWDHSQLALKLFSFTVPLAEISYEFYNVIKFGSLIFDWSFNKFIKIQMKDKKLQILRQFRKNLL